MTEFWLISAPGEKTCQQTWEKLHAATTKNNNLAVSSKFNIPDLKVGTLDVLVGLSDELAKLDAFVEGVVKKVAQYMADVLEDSKDKVQENLLANGVDLVTYITRFQWDMAKYPIKQSLKNISEIIAKGVTQIDNDLKSRASAYNNLKGNLQNLERKNAGSLLTRSLAEIVKKDDFVLDSEYLVTLLVVVPKLNHNDWIKQYETLAEMVVPRSSNVLSEDQDSYLCNVTLFRKAVDDFRHKARENKFIVRDFQYNEEEMKADKEEMNRLSTDKKKQFVLLCTFTTGTMSLIPDQGTKICKLHSMAAKKKNTHTHIHTHIHAFSGPLVRWLKVNFSEAFIAWIHVKALRVFVESVLRYGLPVNFQAMLLQPNKKTMKKLREVLYELYKHLDSSAAAIIDAPMDIPGLNLSQQEYYPYVYYKIDCNLLEFK
ncbi:V-type proton ATPase subunit C 1 [Bos mutus]|uniref:V-type proton ATPase subunit C n=1 Tax=Bos mutus TaxID=72004 RepID=L8IE54_9CETA|nr:V-type proton ATPase subunit C 1 [Bos mutus]